MFLKLLKLPDDIPPVPPLLPTSTSPYSPRKKLPLHKLIRLLSSSQNPPPSLSSSLSNHLSSHPSSLLQPNGVGWLPLHLAAYHSLPYPYWCLVVDSCPPPVLSACLRARTPTGGRNVYHFLARFCADVRVWDLLVPLEPRPVLDEGDDGLTPLGRARVNRKG
eukprot:CAMPEP_0197561940 /NCGR_PEP_ID=MMETSP1320-20131121/26117_1 /TAXON_ID=91990 /ORGANISM="Bolidomonas sp., Strain RCC2347" /LENGTH=162 /DNA_ID=CAMNT_0043123631 /DNA_START=129 /DNA_END=615 /DNA_ORIENTATION=-